MVGLPAPDEVQLFWQAEFACWSVELAKPWLPLQVKHPPGAEIYRSPDPRTNHSEAAAVPTLVMFEVCCSPVWKA